MILVLKMHNPLSGYMYCLVSVLYGIEGGYWFGVETAFQSVDSSFDGPVELSALLPQRVLYRLTSEGRGKPTNFGPCWSPYGAQSSGLPCSSWTTDIGSMSGVIQLCSCKKTPAVFVWYWSSWVPSGSEVSAVPFSHCSCFWSAPPQCGPSRSRCVTPAPESPLIKSGRMSVYFLLMYSAGILEYQLFGLRRIQEQVVLTAHCYQMFLLFSVSWLITQANESHHHGIVCKLHVDVVNEGAVVCVEGTEQDTQGGACADADDQRCVMTYSLCVTNQKAFNLHAGDCEISRFHSFLNNLWGRMVLKTELDPENQEDTGDDFGLQEEKPPTRCSPMSPNPDSKVGAR